MQKYKQKYTFSLESMRNYLFAHLQLNSRRRPSSKAQWEDFFQ